MKKTQAQARSIGAGINKKILDKGRALNQQRASAKTKTAPKKVYV